jgi:dUTP pyrophosphatase
MNNDFKNVEWKTWEDHVLQYKVKRLTPDAKLPIKSTEQAAGLDFFASDDFLIEPNKVTMVKTGIAAEIPQGFWGFTRPRSGMGTKFGIAISSSSTIDSDYRGELMFPFTTHKNESYQIHKGDKIGQMMILPVPVVEVVEVEELSGTQRGEGGFGSTGK